MLSAIYYHGICVLCTRWTGSNTNPKNNDGQGLAGTDRSNLVMQADRAYMEDSSDYWLDTGKYGHWGRSYPAQLNSATVLGLSESERTMLAVLSPGMTLLPTLAFLTVFLLCLSHILLPFVNRSVQG